MRRAPLLVVTGTGTGIGKTHTAGALVLAWAQVLRDAGLPNGGVAGLKPVESGVGYGVDALSDGETLAELSTFHVKHSAAPYRLARPVSPHLAARDTGQTIELARIRDHVDAVRYEADAVVVELPGGLFTPLGPRITNADLCIELTPDATILVAPDRLGVLHDSIATIRAAATASLPLHGIVLVAPAVEDSSTGTNAAELGLVTALCVLAVLPRAAMAVLATRGDLLSIVRPFVTR